MSSFEPDDYNGFQSDVKNAIKQLNKAKVTNLLIDLTNNSGKRLSISKIQHRFQRLPKVDTYVLVSSCTSTWSVPSLDMRRYQCIVEKYMNWTLKQWIPINDAWHHILSEDPQSRHRKRPQQQYFFLLTWQLWVSPLVPSLRALTIY